MNPTMPLSHFKILVKCQKQNGVKLLQGCDDGRAAKEFISAIAAAVKEKVASILVELKFISTLLDGSQTRKTGTDMELILSEQKETEIPVYFVSSLANMAEYGGNSFGLFLNFSNL